MMAALVLATVAGVAEAAQSVPTLRSAGEGNNRRPTPPRRDTALDRDIADWNEAIERRRAAKMARKLGR